MWPPPEGGLRSRRCSPLAEPARLNIHPLQPGAPVLSTFPCRLTLCRACSLLTNSRPAVRRSESAGNQLINDLYCRQTEAATGSD